MEGNLCYRCEVLDFKSILANNKNYSRVHAFAGLLDEFKICDLGPLDSQTKCTLCRIFCNNVAAAHKATGSHFELHAFPPRFMMRGTKVADAWLLSKVALLKVLPYDTQYFLGEDRRALWARRLQGAHRYLELSSHDFVPARNHILLENPAPFIDWDMVRRWITECDRAHLACHDDRLASPSLPGLVVVDCKNRRLQRLPNPDTPYMTLSYVWGSKKGPDAQGDNVLDHVPQLIEDAFQVVLLLGYRYLWIDRYCIPQNDNGEKHRLIQEMGNIYNGSRLTLIAAAGVDPGHGLPGVSVISRWNPQIVNLGETKLKEVRADFRTAIESSKWNTRGWTYQEAALSHRRLAFTDAGLYFQCGTSRFVECIHTDPLNKPMPRLLIGDEWDVDPRVVKRFFPSLWGQAKVDIGRCIEEFSRREFTYDDDVLNAFRGILHVFSEISTQSSAQLQSLCGVPFVDPIVGGRPKTAYLVSGLAWQTHYEPSGDDRATCSQLRRPNFPSWTWAGWRFRLGRNLFNRHRSSGFERPFLLDTNVSIAVEFRDGLVMDWEEQYPAILAQESSNNVPFRLRIYALAINISPGSCVVVRKQSRISFKVGGRSLELEVLADLSDIEVANSLCKAIVIGHRPNSVIWCTLLLLRKTNVDGHFERIGIGQDCRLEGRISPLAVEGDFERENLGAWEEVVVE